MGSYRKPKSNASDKSDWMGLLPESVTTMQLRQLAIPGSNESFSCTTNHINGVAPDKPLLLRIASHFCCCFGKELIHNWSKTQHLTVEQQLTSGIRYFDVRIAAKPRRGSFWFSHGLYGSKVEECLKDIKSFLDNHKKEIIIFDVNHFYRMNDILHRKLLSVIAHAFEEKLCPYRMGLDVRLNTLWQHGYQVIVIYHHDIVQEYEDFWPSKSIQNIPCSLRSSCEIVIQELEKGYVKPRGQTFFCFRGVIEPTNKMMCSRLQRTRKTELSNKMAPLFTSWMKGKCNGENGLNICVMDFVENSKFISNVIDLNLTSEYISMNTETLDGF